MIRSTRLVAIYSIELKLNYMYNQYYSVTTVLRVTTK